MSAEINYNKASENNPKKRVLFIITQSEFGGAQMFLAQVINHLNRSNFELLIAGGRQNNEEMRSLLPENTNFLTLKNLSREINFFSDLASVFEIKKIIKEFRPQTVFLNSTKAGFNGSLAVKMLPSSFPRPKVIYRIGGWTFNDPWPTWKKYFYRSLEKLSASWKDYIIVNNKHDFDQAIEYKIIPKQKVVLIHNGIDPYKVELLNKDEAKNQLYEKLPEKSDKFLEDSLTIGTIANFYPTKGLGYAIDAISRLRISSPEIKIKYVIIGDGPERKSLETKIKEAGLENKVFLIGRIANAYKYLAAFDIFLLPSVKEGFSWALLEAMSSKLPVIATSVGANPELIENQKSGFLIPSANSQAIVEAIQKLAPNESLQRELGIQAHQIILHKFNLRKMLEQVESLL